MSWIRSYGCATAAGDGVAKMWSALLEGRDLACLWPGEESVSAFLFNDREKQSVRDLLVTKLRRAFSEVRKDVQLNARLGVIFASTKGCSEDFIWQDGAPGFASDPLTPVLNEFLRQSELRPERQIVVSNACSSVLAALALGQRWLNQGLEQVLVMGADAVTPFVIRGFQSLKLISPGPRTPFGVNRCGFFLGDAAAVFLLDRASSPGALALKLHPIGLDTEGAAVTRPSSSGESLIRAARRIPDLANHLPDVIVAHGTGTPINDETEDLAFANLFAHRPWITGTKWCFGHTLGASGALDIIAAAEALRAQRLMRLHFTDEIDPRLRGRYLNGRAGENPSAFARILISSLGFGGMHASALLERE